MFWGCRVRCAITLEGGEFDPTEHLPARNTYRTLQPSNRPKLTIELVVGSELTLTSTSCLN